MKFYDRFEQTIAITLTGIISVIILVSVVQLIRNVFFSLILGALDPLEHNSFQAIFGMIMTVLIAMEFKHSIIQVALRRDSFVQVKTVVLIGLIAIARKFVIVDVNETEPAKLAALAGMAISLGVTYWLLREREDRMDESGKS
ncbi:MAG: phosphate-starvation-inducible PsiE family protein [Bdellovibrionaceae bacterium]|nr:phosphate-starvation-inducible PsiE family protein [Pseudobdellovibrionaceae bacterium]